MNWKKKIFPLEKLSELKKRIGHRRISLVGGCFDVFHYGHFVFLQKAKLEGDVLVVLLESDHFIKKYKEGIMFHSQDQRAEILSGLEVVDYVVCLPFFEKPDASYKHIVEELSPVAIPITEGDSNYKKKERLAKKVHARIVVIDQLQSFSSSHIKTYATILRD